MSSGLYNSPTGLAPNIDRLTGTDQYDLANPSVVIGGPLVLSENVAALKSCG